jgi:hypothetical protein
MHFRPKSEKYSKIWLTSSKIYDATNQNQPTKLTYKLPGKKKRFQEERRKEEWSYT